MPGKTLKSIQEIEDFVRGCTFFGTGGGGKPENGIESLVSEFKKGKEIGWIDVEDLPDDSLSACPFLMGSIAPLTEQTYKEMAAFGLGQRVNKDKECLAKAVLELSAYTGRKISALVPVELGGGNTPGCIAAGIVNGIPTVDGDYTGRAIPEITQTTPYLMDKALLPITTVDGWGNVCIIKSGTGYAMAERIGKLISAASFGSTGDAGFLLSGRETKEAVVRGTLTECFTVGKMIREARESGKDPVAEVVQYLGGWLVCEGTVSKKEWEDRLGYFWGTHTISGEGRFKGDTLKIWFKNENHVCWKNDQAFVTSPDSIIVVNASSGEPITNTKIAEGDRVSVIVRKANPLFRTPKAIEVLGPKAFGFELDYVPAENRLSAEEAI